MCVGVSVWLVGVVSVWKVEASTFHMDNTPTSRTETPTHVEIRTRNQCGDTTEKSQAPDDGCYTESVEKNYYTKHKPSRTYLDLP